jgi:hypothetical protein
MIIPDAQVVYLELRMLGTFISAIAYGFVIVLSGHCLFLLHKKQAIYSNRMQIFLFIYVTVMFLLSTMAIAQSIWGTTLITFHPDHYSSQSLHTIRLYALVENLASTLPLTIWGADGFMVSIFSSTGTKIPMGLQLQIWRCAVFYQGVAKGPRIVVFVLLSLIAIISLGRLSSFCTHYTSICS